MYKSHIYQSNEIPPRDSESESTPLLSSGSHTSLEPIILFGDSETSDLDPSPVGYSILGMKQLHLQSVTKLYIYIFAHGKNIIVKLY